MDCKQSFFIRGSCKARSGPKWSFATPSDQSSYFLQQSEQQIGTRGRKARTKKHALPPAPKLITEEAPKIPITRQVILKASTTAATQLGGALSKNISHPALQHTCTQHSAKTLTLFLQED